MSVIPWDKPRIVIATVFGVLLVALLAVGFQDWNSPESRVRRCVESHMKDHPDYNYTITYIWCRDQITPGWVHDEKSK